MLTYWLWRSLPFLIFALFFLVNYTSVFLFFKVFLKANRLWIRSLYISVLSAATILIGLYFFLSRLMIRTDFLLESIALLIVFILNLILIFYYGLGFVGNLKRQFPNRSILSVLMAGINLIVSVGIVVLIMVVAIWVDENPCEYKSGKYFHYFNDHVKSLCLRADNSECPHNLEELRAFDPQTMSALEKCANIKYEFNQETELPLWQVQYKNMILNFDADDEGGFKLNDTP